MAELIDLEEPCRISQTLRRMQAGLSPLHARFEGVERQPAVEASIRRTASSTPCPRS